MPDRYLITAADNTYTGPAADIWHANPNQAAGDGLLFTEAADVAVLNANSGNFALGAAMACIGFDARGWTGTLALGAHGLDANGNMYLEGAVVTGSGNISAGHDIVSLAADFSGHTGTLIHDGAAGSHTLYGYSTIFGAFEVNNNPTTFTLYDQMTVGPLTFTGGKFTTTGTTISLKAGTHDVDWNTAPYALGHLNITDGAKAVLTGYLRIGEITFGTGVGGVALDGGAQRIYLYCTGNDRWHQPVGGGTVSGSLLYISLSGANREIGYVDASNFTGGVVVLAADATRTLSMTDDWALGAAALAVYADDLGDASRLNANGHGLTAGVATLGAGAEANKSGVIVASTGQHSFISVLSGNAANANNAYDFGTGQTRLSTADNNWGNIAVTGGGAQIVAASINHCDVTGKLRAWGVNDGGDNVNVEWQPRQIGIMPLAA